MRSLLLFIVCTVLSLNAWSRGGGGCFLAETPILRADGTTVAINQMKQGDQVAAYDSKGHFKTAKVQAVFQHEVDDYYVLSTATATLKVTGEHPFYVGNGTFKTVEALHVGDTIYAYAPNHLIKQAIVSKKAIYANTLVYNIQTNEPHTYFADGIAVHNKGGGGGGGGGGFHGSSGGGSGNSCRPGDTACEVFNILFAIVIIIFVIYGMIYGKDEEDLDYLNSRNNIERKSLKTLKLIDFISRQDPTVLPRILEERVRNTFLKLQQCWMNRDYLPMKELMMSSLYNQHLSQIEGMIRNHEINKIDNLRIVCIDLVNVRYTEKPYQREFTALITANATDYYVNDTTGSRLRGDTTSATFQEFWTFQLEPTGWLLRDIEQARESDYLKEENFVEMFTDLQIKKIYGDDVDNLGTSGPWLPKAVAQKENKVDRMLNFLAQSSKIWDRQAMIIRVRSVFTQVHMALEAGKLNPETQNTLYPEIATEMKERLDAWKADGNTIEYRNFCIRKVEIVLVNSFNDKSKNEFTARISAHAQIIHLKNGKTISKDDDVTPFVEFWEFGYLDNEWKLKDAKPQMQADIISAENTEEGSSPNLVKWYYTKKRAM